uniref:BZIP domain-containing protein n=1 Tax=Oryza rufipogon TaxID=4529 RepID=A0A0E0MXQ9_ORYRU
MEEAGKRKREEYSSDSEQRSRSRARRRRRLAAQAAALRSENCAVEVAAREAVGRCAAVDAENELLRAREAELAARLRSLRDDLQAQRMQQQEALPSSSPPQPPPPPRPSTSVDLNH